MLIKQYIIGLFILAIFIVLSFPRIALADSVSLSGSVKDSSVTPIPGSIVNVNGISSDSATTDGSGEYSLSIPSGIYDVHVMPPLMVLP